MDTKVVPLLVCLVFFLGACAGPETAVSPTIAPTTLLPTATPVPPTATPPPTAEPAPTETTEQTPDPLPVAASETEETAVPEPTSLAAEEPASVETDTFMTEESIIDLVFTGEAGLEIQTTRYLPTGEAPHRGVLLLHMVGGSRQDWVQIGFAQQLLAQGYAVLAIDLRGHGQTGGGRDWEMAIVDIGLVWQQFVADAAVDSAKTAVIGASIGSNLALVLGALQPELKTAVLLSPGLDYFGVTTDDSVVAYGNRPLLIVASEEDSYSANSSRTLLDLASDQAALQMYSGIGHGSNMLRNRDNVQNAILEWLNMALETPS